MKKIIRAFQVINRDGEYAVSTTYNEIDDTGKTIRTNVKDSFYAVDQDLVGHIGAIEEFLKTRIQE